MSVSVSVSLSVSVSVSVSGAAEVASGRCDVSHLQHDDARLAVDLRGRSVGQ